MSHNANTGETRRLRYVIVAAVDSQEPGVHSAAGLAYTADEVLTQIANPENRTAIRELWSDYDRAFPS